MIEMNNKTTLRIIMIILALLAGSLIAISIFKNITVIEKREIEMAVIVGEHYGMDASTSRLAFGMIPPGAGGFRMMNLSNNREKRIIVDIRKQGEIADFVSTEQYRFSLNPRENKEIKMHIQIPENATLGSYSGKLIVTFRRF